jgi:RimJ/RimL family protein N-acetyltransferase/quercetin dioxygenase-like cupin family protein
MPDVILRPTTMTDLDFVLAAESAPENRRFVRVWPREQHATAMSSPMYAHRIVADASSGKAVGYVILMGLGEPHHSIEFRRLVITDKGHGYGRAAVRAIKQLAFQELAAHRLWLDVKEFNHVARQLYQSEGFVTEGLLRDFFLGESGFESLYIMSILESEYERQVQTTVAKDGSLEPGESQTLETQGKCPETRMEASTFQAYRILFDQIEWQSPQPGVRFKVHRAEAKQVRLVEFTSEFVEAEWCEKGHAGFVLSGGLEVDFGGHIVRFSEGTALLIPAGAPHAHKARAVTSVVRLFLVEDNVS